ncbi:MAG: aspartate ammonia-lyase [Anaerovoracaceae bacterium]
MNIRKEYDVVGPMDIPSSAYYGIHSLRAKDNFNITGLPLHPRFIKNIVLIKKAAAFTNFQCGDLTKSQYVAIDKACNFIIDGNLYDQFIVDMLQGGAGTSSNMNANEVIANKAIELLGGNKGDYSIIHPNDHVNMCQSTNDVIPTAGKITIIELITNLVDSLQRLNIALLDKSAEFHHIIKMGRTQMQDAVPMRLGQSFEAYAHAIERDIKCLNLQKEFINEVNLGGTAIGNSINANSEYLENIVSNLSDICGINLRSSLDKFDATSNLDTLVRVSGAIKSCAVSLSKMCNDLRLISSGPTTGIGEINLPPRQNGSSIMPGKVNPVIPEVINQIAYQIIGNDTTVTIAAESGQLELNAFEPVIFKNIFESAEYLTNGVNTLIENCIIGITANQKRCHELVTNSYSMATILSPVIGYNKASQIAKEAQMTGKSVRQLVKNNGLDVVFDKILKDTFSSEEVLTIYSV